MRNVPYAPGATLIMVDLRFRMFRESPLRVRPKNLVIWGVGAAAVGLETRNLIARDRICRSAPECGGASWRLGSHGGSGYRDRNSRVFVCVVVVVGGRDNKTSRGPTIAR